MTTTTKSLPYPPSRGELRYLGFHLLWEGRGGGGGEASPNSRFELAKNICRLRRSNEHQRPRGGEGILFLLRIHVSKNNCRDLTALSSAIRCAELNGLKLGAGDHLLRGGLYSSRLAQREATRVLVGRLRSRDDDFRRSLHRVRSVLGSTDRDS